MSQRRQESRRAKQERRERRRPQISRTGGATAPRPRPAVAGAAVAPTRATPVRRSPVSPRAIWLALGGVALLVAIGAGIFIWRSASAPLPGTMYETQGNEHLADASSPHPAYNSNPPTSGWHLPPIPRPGIYVTPVVPEGLGHFMEHGGVWVLYNCPDGCPEDVAALERIVNEANDDNRPVALAPFPSMESRFATVAWQYNQLFDTVDRGGIKNFIARHSCRYNPEGPGYCTAVRGKIGTAPALRPEGPVITPTSVFATPVTTPATPAR